MKKWIDEIRMESVHYGTELWKYHISGTVLELSINSPHHLNKRKYRDAVIKIGMAIQALSFKIENAGCSYLIQSFPSLEDIRIVATIRITGEQTPLSVPSNEDSATTLFDVMQNLAEKYQFELNHVDEQSLPEELVKKHSSDVKWYSLTSQYNNPFTWLKIGNWQELVYYSIEKSGIKKNSIFFIECPDSFECFKKDSTVLNRFVQTLIAIEN